MALKIILIHIQDNFDGFRMGGQSATLWKNRSTSAGRPRVGNRSEINRGVCTGNQMTRSLPPSTGTCAPVVLAKAGPHICMTSSATSRLATSVFNTLLRLYSSTDKP